MAAVDGRTTDARWDPDQYLRFHEERSQPFRDLASLIERHPAMRVVDLGCGPGDMTAWLHGELAAYETVGIDSSVEMLARARQHSVAGLRFETRDIIDFATAPPHDRYDLIFSNAALQWVGDHEALIADLTARLQSGGQLAIQVPTSSTHPAGPILSDLGREEPYASVMAMHPRTRSTLAAERYAHLLHDRGFAKVHVRMQVYSHVLSNSLEVVEWFKGSALAPYRAHLPADLYERFVAEYTRRVAVSCGSASPYFLPMNRILMWGQLP